MCTRHGGSGLKEGLPSKYRRRTRSLSLNCCSHLLCAGFHTCSVRPIRKAFSEDRKWNERSANSAVYLPQYHGCHGWLNLRENPLVVLQIFLSGALCGGVTRTIKNPEPHGGQAGGREVVPSTTKTPSGLATASAGRESAVHATALLTHQSPFASAKT